jgi:predicted nucleic acid-binding protein
LISPAVYLDTNICRDVMKNRNPDSAVLFEKIRENSWKCYTSVFTFMETADVQQEDLFVEKMGRRGWEYNKICRTRSKKELTDEELQRPISDIKNFFIHYKFVKPIMLSDAGWQTALLISYKTTMMAPDAIHLASSWDSNCHVLVTHDEDFIKLGNDLLKKEGVHTKMKICKPKEVVRSLREIMT